MKYLKYQINVSRNQKELMKQKLLRLFWATMFFIKAVHLGLKAMRHEQGLSEVLYKGERCRIVNWAGSAYPTIASDKLYLERVPRCELQNIVTFEEFIHRFKMIFSWYMSNWFCIDIQQKIYK